MLVTLLRCLKADNAGSTATEYALIAALIAVAAAGAMFNLGNQVRTNMEQVEDATRSAND